MYSYPITFNALRDRILRALLDKSKLIDLGIKESVTFVEGFVSLPIQYQLTDKKMDIADVLNLFTKDNVPSVILIGNDSAQVYIFKLDRLIDL